MQQTIESLALEVSQLESWDGSGRHALTIARERLHLARGPNDCIELFIEGPRASFGYTAIGKCLEWGEFHDRNARRQFSALVIRALDSATAVRLMAHVAYEALQLLAGKSEITNSDLLSRLQPFVSLVIDRSILTIESQMGLVGELMLINELLNFADAHVPRIDPTVVLSTWKGWDLAGRDFLGGKVAIEVKTTARTARQHTINAMSQLLSDVSRTDERVYVYSVGLRPDRSSSFRLMAAFDRVLVRLDGSARNQFVECSRKYGSLGLDSALRGYYDLEPGFVITHSPAIFQTDNSNEILRPNSFVGGVPPNRVSRIRYDFALEGLAAATEAERSEVYAELLVG